MFVLTPQRRDYLTVMTKQKLFSFDGKDERVCYGTYCHAVYFMGDH